MWRRLRNIHVLLLVRAYEDSPVLFGDDTHRVRAGSLILLPRMCLSFLALFFRRLGLYGIQTRSQAVNVMLCCFSRFYKSLVLSCRFFGVLSVCLLCPASVLRPLACAFLFYLWPSVAALFITRFPRFFAFSLRLLGRSYRVVFN